MILSAIKYRVRTEERPRLYRFQPPKGRVRNFFCHMAPKAEIDDFGKAVVFALTGETSPRVSEVTLYFNDDAGESWIVERTPFKSRVFRNRQEIQESPEKALAGALYDLDLINVENATEQNNLCKRYEMHEEEDGQLLAFQLSNESQFQIHLKKEVEEQGRKILHGLKKFLGTDAYVDASMLGKLLSRIEPAYYVWKEVSKQLATLREEAGKSASVDPQLVHKLETELDLMAQLEETAAPLIDPAKNPAVLTEKLKQVEGQLKSICRKNDIQTLPIHDVGINWENLMMQLSRLRACENLRNAFMETYQKYKADITPVFEDHLETVDTLLQNDLQITSELEACLTTLTASMTKVRTQAAEEQSAIGKLWSKLKSPASEGSATKALVVQTQMQNRELENGRMAVDYALGRLGELHSNLKSSRSINEEIFFALEEKREKLFGEVEELRQNWEASTKKHNLPADSSIRSLLGIINNYGQIADLWQKRECLRSQIKNYKTGLAGLEKLIHDWRHTTGSQKQTPLDTTSILIGEARGILEYKQKKQEHLNKLKDHEARITVYHDLMQRFEGRLNQVRAEWQGAFEGLGLPQKTIENDNWPQFFGTARKLASMTSLAKETLQPLKDAAIFSSKALESPLTIYSWNSEVSYNKSRTQMLEHLKKAHDSGCGLLLMADPHLGKMLDSLELGFTTTVTPPEKKAPPAATKPLSQKQMLNDRAKSALAILTSDTKKRTLDK